MATTTTSNTAQKAKDQSRATSSFLGRNFDRRRLVELLPPFVAFVLFIAIWYGVKSFFEIPSYLLPSPDEIIRAGVGNWDYLLNGIYLTFGSALIGFIAAAVVGVGAAIVMSQSRILERSLYPYALVLQTMPIVAIAPIIVVWIGAGRWSIVVIAFIIALFPVISNTTLGLASTDHNLVNLLSLYDASKFQTLRKLRLPFAFPYIIGGFKISAGLSVVGAIVGEFVAGLGGRAGGLGFQIAESATMVRTSYLFAAAFSACFMGLVVFWAVSGLSDRLLRNWHESRVVAEN